MASVRAAAAQGLESGFGMGLRVRTNAGGTAAEWGLAGDTAA